MKVTGQQYVIIEQTVEPQQSECVQRVAPCIVSLPIISINLSHNPVVQGIEACVQVWTEEPETLSAPTADGSKREWEKDEEDKHDWFGSREDYFRLPWHDIDIGMRPHQQLPWRHLAAASARTTPLIFTAFHSHTILTVIRCCPCCCCFCCPFLALTLLQI